MSKIHEADPECAFLNESDLVDYVISDDSDVFLFGSVKVIRNFYKRNHSPWLYSSDAIGRCLSLSRIQLIMFAMLVGCDYALPESRALAQLGHYRSSRNLSVMMRMICMTSFVNF